MQRKPAGRPIDPNSPVHSTDDPIAKARIRRRPVRFARRQDPSRGYIKLDLAPALRRAGYINARGRFAGEIAKRRFSRDADINYASLIDYLTYSAGVESIYFSVLARICRTLRCQPGDILTYVPPSIAPAAPLSATFAADPEHDPYSNIRPIDTEFDPEAEEW